MTAAERYKKETGCEAYRKSTHHNAMNHDTDPTPAYVEWLEEMVESMQDVAAPGPDSDVCPAPAASSAPVER